MEFLFTNQVASVEAWMFFICIAIVGLILSVDLVAYIKRVYYVFHPRKAYVMENSSTTEELSPALDTPETPLSPISETTETNESWESLDGDPIWAHASVDEETPGKMDEIPWETDIRVETPIEVVSPFLEEPLVTNVTPPDATLEQDITENIVVPDLTAEEALATWEEKTEEILDSIEAREEENTPDDTDLIGHTTPDAEPVALLEESHDDSVSDEEEVSPMETPETVSEKPELSPSSEEVPGTREIAPESERSLSREKQEKVVEIVSMTHTLIARGQLEEARTFIVSGLALDKDHRELNLLMASLYERDHAYTKAEYIFKDLAKLYPDDIEILEHLATALAMQHRYELAYEIYKKIISLGGENEEILYTITHLASELSLSDDVYIYAKSYLKQYPRNPEILWLYSQSLIKKWERKEAIETLIKLKNLTPYNQEIVDLIGKLVTEEELAGNFWEEQK